MHVSLAIKLATSLFPASKKVLFLSFIILLCQIIHNWRREWLNEQAVEPTLPSMAGDCPAWLVIAQQVLSRREISSPPAHQNQQNATIPDNDDEDHQIADFEQELAKLVVSKPQTYSLPPKSD